MIPETVLCLKVFAFMKKKELTFILSLTMCLESGPVCLLCSVLTLPFQVCIHVNFLYIFFDAWASSSSVQTESQTHLQTCWLLYIFPTKEHNVDGFLSK